MDVSKYTWMRDGCILVVEISSFKDGVFKTFLKSDEYAFFFFVLKCIFINFVFNNYRLVMGKAKVPA